MIGERQRVLDQLEALGIRTWPSRANFILFEVSDAKGAYLQLLKRGVRIRDVSSMPGMKQHLRVTIGTPEENDLFLNAISSTA